MKKEITKTAILLAVFLLLAVIWSNLLFTAQRYYPNAVVGSSDVGLNATFLDLKEESFSLAAVRSATVAEKENDIPQRVDVFYTDEKFAERASIEMLYGSYFIDSYEATKYAVIGESLAVELFFTAEAVDSEFYINGERYVVCGVYRELGGLLGELTATSRPRVYLPYTHLADPYQTRANMIFLDPDTMPFTAAAESVVQDLTGKPIYAERFTSYPDLLAVYAFMQKLFIALAGWILSAWLLYYAYKRIIRAVKARRYETEERIKHAVIGGVSGVAAIVIVFLVSFEPDFPSVFLPPENVFDLSHYLSLWTDAVQSLNGSTVFDPWLCLSVRHGEWLTAVYVMGAAVSGWILVRVWRKGLDGSI